MILTKIMKKKYLFIAAAILLAATYCFGNAGESSEADYPQENDRKTAKNYIVGFYNLENLFDTFNDPAKNDEEFLPEGKNKWTQAK